jgi:disulfide bond formation protein DsbB
MSTVAPRNDEREGEQSLARRQIDPRGPRFVASLTMVVLAVALVASPSTLTTVLVAVQAVVFGIGAVAGISHTPYSWLFKTLVRPRLAPSAELEDAAPPRFAQGVGLVFAVVALGGYLAGADLVGAIATGFALAAAFLNAVFGLCLGCEMYLLIRRIAPARPAGT